MNITINTQGPCSMIIDTRSGNIQVQGEYNVVVESEPVTITGQSFPEREVEEMQSIINPTEQEKREIQPFGVGTPQLQSVFDILREDLTDQEEEPPEEEDESEEAPPINALSNIAKRVRENQNKQKKRGRPAKHKPDIKAKDDTDEQIYNGKTIRNRYWTRKAAGAPTPVVDFTRVNKIPFQAFMDIKREIEKE